MIFIALSTCKDCQPWKIFASPDDCTEASLQTLLVILVRRKTILITTMELIQDIFCFSIFS